METIFVKKSVEMELLPKFLLYTHYTQLLSAPIYKNPSIYANESIVISIVRTLF